MPISRVPSFSGRPGFPAGLKVLVIDSDASDLALAVSQLQQCSYEVHGCENEAEAEAALKSAEGGMDVVLWQTSVLSLSSAAKSSFLPKIADVPLVLMGENSTQQQMVTGLKLGAVDFLEKPISMLKLRNIWQHTVRKMLKAKSSSQMVRSTSKAAELEPVVKTEPERVAAAPATECAWQQGERHDESTDSSEALQHQSDSGAKATAGASSPVGKAESRRQGSQATEAVPSAKTATQPAATRAATAAPEQPQQSLPTPSPSAAQYCMQGMPAPLPGCVWGLPMLPPPVPGLVGPPVPWMQGMMPYTPHGQPAAASMSSSLSNQPHAMYGLAPSAAKPSAVAASLPAPHTRGGPAGYWVTPSPSVPCGKSLPAPAASGQVPCTTGSNSNSDATWHMDAEVWAGMEDMFELDDPEDPAAAKQDLNDLLNVRIQDYDAPHAGGGDAAAAAKDASPAPGGLCDADFHLDLDTEGAGGSGGLDDGGLGDEAFDSTFGLLGGEFEMKMHNSPSLLDMMDNLCPVDAAT